MNHEKSKTVSSITSIKRPMKHVYISYSRENNDFVDLIEADLIERDHPTWRDTSSIEGGENWDNAIKVALSDAYAMLVVLSNKSTVSEWVKHEIGIAQKEQLPIITLQLESCEMPGALGDTDTIDFSKIRGAQGIEQVRQYRQALRRLVDALDETRPVRQYLKELVDSHDVVRENAARKLGELGDLSAAEALIQALSDPDVDVRFYASEALGKLKSEVALKSLIRLLSDDDPDVCSAAAIALGQIGLPNAAGPLIDQLEHSDRFVRAGAVWALGNLKAVEAVRPLIHMMRNDSISDVREAATVALCKIGGPEAQRALNRTGIDCRKVLDKDNLVDKRNESG